MRTYRTTVWKLTRDFLNSGRDELYDLKHDPDETTNLIGSDRADARSAFTTLSDKMLARMRELGDPVANTVNANDDVDRR
jgi:uncharacterized sulfatase